jgi:hypothetical protein
VITRIISSTSGLVFFCPAFLEVAAFFLIAFFLEELGEGRALFPRAFLFCEVSTAADLLEGRRETERRRNRVCVREKGKKSDGERERVRERENKGR